MESTIRLTEEIQKRLESKSSEFGITPNELANNILAHGLEEDIDDIIFETRTREALERVEKRGVKGVSAKEFLKELDTW